MVFFSEAYLRNKLFLEQALAVNPMGAYPDGTNAGAFPQENGDVLVRLKIPGGKTASLNISVSNYVSAKVDLQPVSGDVFEGTIAYDPKLNGPANVVLTVNGAQVLTPDLPVIWTDNRPQNNIELPEKGGEYLMERVKEILHTYGDFEAIGISTAGQVNSEKGEIHYANDNIPNYTGMKIRAILEKEFGVPVAVENDVNSAAIGELRFGAAKGSENFLCLTYGTGVGGAIVLNGEIYAGNTFSGGSFGGIVVHPEAMEKDVEFSGCYEKYASTTALVQRVMAVDASLDNGRKIFEAFGRSEIRSEIDAWIDEIVYGLITLIHIFNPSDILLGGGILAQKYIIDEVRRRVNESISEGFRGTKIHQTELGNQAGLLGAAWLALNMNK